MENSDVFVLSATRTAIGKYGGGLAAVPPCDLAATVVREAVSRAGVDPDAVGHAVFGHVIHTEVRDMYLARVAAVNGGLGVQTPAFTLNRLCGSGLQAIVSAAQGIRLGDCEVAVAGGVESMSRAPWVLLKPTRAYPVGSETLHSTTLGWRMVNPRMPERWTISLGASAERLAEIHDVSREAQDAFALRSHRLAAKAYDEGVMGEVVAVPGVELARDEGIRTDTTLEALAELAPAFVDGGTVTAGNSSSLNDGASMVLIGDKQAGRLLGREPLARIVSMGAAGVDPDVFGIAPVEAANLALSRAGIGWGEVAAVELNEAFASQSLACLSCWPQLNPELVNVRGGAIAIGHPLGASGTRILGRLTHELHARGGGYGLAAICIGVGQGLAMILEG